MKAQQLQKQEIDIVFIIKIEFHHNDHLGSTSVITNESGGVAEKTFYDPYGAILSGGSESRYDYEGKEFSEVTNDYDYNFRKYNPELLMFTKPDSGVSNVYDPQLLNRYSFERNNPYKYVDKDGKEPIDANALYIVNSGISSTIGVILTYNFRSNVDTSSLTPFGFIGVRAYDVLLKSQIDVQYYELVQSNDLVFQSSPYANPSPAELKKIRRDAVFGASSLGLFVGGGIFGGGLNVMSSLDTGFSLFTGGGIVENIYNSYNYLTNSNVQIDSAQQSTISSIRGSESSSNYQGISSSGRESSGTNVINNAVNKIGSAIENVVNAIKNFVGGLFK